MLVGFEAGVSAQGGSELELARGGEPCEVQERVIRVDVEP